MKFLRKLARRKAPPPVSGPSLQESTTALASNDIATHGRLAESPSTEERQPAAPATHRASDRSGHQYDSVHIGGASRNHLGDVYTSNVTYNYGAPSLSPESTEKQQEDEDARRREAARLGAERRLEEERRLASGHHRLEFLQALHFDVMNSRQATIGLAHTDTCTWIVEAPEYLRWRDESCLPEHHGVLWIKGNPGCGKSTLMKYALDIAQKRDPDGGDIIASFFFNARGQPLEKSAEGMYRSLLRQALSKLPHLYIDQIHVKQQNWPVEMLDAMLQASVLALNPEDRLVFYIDALDECNQDEIRDVVGRFEDLVDLAVSRGLRCSICFSSRHYPHITMHRFEELKLDDQYQHVEDISKYVHSHVSRLSIANSAKAVIEAKIRHRSSGVFLWAVLVIKILREKHDNGAPLSRLNNSLAAVPDRLGSLFTSILADSNKSTITALQWMLYAGESLTPCQLYFAIKTSTNQLSTGRWNRDDVDQDSIKRFIMGTTRGLIETVNNENSSREEFSTLQFIHESVREFLLQGGLASLTLSDQHLVEGSAHADIARCCLSYIQLDLSMYTNYCNSLPFESQFLSETLPLFQYAATGLPYHANLACKAGALSVSFLSELPLRLVIRIDYSRLISRAISWEMSWEESLAFIESLTILSWLVINRDYALAEGLLAGCVKTKTPGIVTFGSTAQSAITFDINQCASELPYSMLGAAALYGKIQLMQQLIYLGAEVNPSERDVRTPLILAIVSRSRDAVELLLQHGADVNAVSSAFEIPLIKAVREKVIPDIVSVLLAYGADLHHRDELGTALDSAIFYRYTRMVRLLWDSHFPESEWNRKAEGYQFDAATVHNIDYHDENHFDKDYEFFNDVSSRDSTHRQYSNYSDMTDTTSFKTI